MIASKILMDFSDVAKYEKSAAFDVGSGTKAIVSIGVNPWNGDVLFTLFLEREKVIENRVCLVGDKLLRGYEGEKFASIINGEFMFINETPNVVIGNKVQYKDLGSTVFLYYIPNGDA